MAWSATAGAITSLPGQVLRYCVTFTMAGADVTPALNWVEFTYEDSEMVCLPWVKRRRWRLTRQSQGIRCQNDAQQPVAELNARLLRCHFSKRRGCSANRDLPVSLLALTDGAHF